MVLQSNYARRASNAENVYPSARLSSKRSSNLRSSIQNASKRRRARNTGTPAKNPRYVVEQAKKKSMTKASTAAVDLEVSVPAAPTHVETKDVEMSDMESSGSGSKAAQKTPVSLPRYLIRPDYKEVSRDIISAIDSELADVPLDYIQEGLEITGPAMLQVLSSVQATPVSNALPKELSILINDLSADLPTHMLAVYSRQSSHSPNLTRRVTLYPTHNLVMAAHCANLPMLPKSTTSEPDDAGNMLLPVVPLCIPAPETFSQLSGYLYTKNAYHLLSTLLPTGIGSTPYSLLGRDETEVQQFSAKLRATYTPHALLTHAMSINGLWRNTVALGIFDDQLWDMLDLSWEVVIGALEGGR